MTPAERIMGGIAVLALALSFVAEAVLSRRERAQPPPGSRSWAHWLWYISTVVVIVVGGWGAVRWEAWNPRKWDLGAFPVLFALTHAAGFFSSEMFLRRSGKPRSVLPLPLQALILGLFLGSALTISVWRDLATLAWFVVLFVVFVGSFYRGVLEWLWTGVVQRLGAAAAEAVRRLWHRLRHS